MVVADVEEEKKVVWEAKQVREEVMRLVDDGQELWKCLEHSLWCKNPIPKIIVKSRLLNLNLSLNLKIFFDSSSTGNSRGQAASRSRRRLFKRIHCTFVLCLEKT